MKRNLGDFARGFLVAAALLSFAAVQLSTGAAAPLASTSAVPASMTVQVRSAVVRGAPSALSPPLFVLEYGAQVSVLRLYEGWAVLAVKGRTEPAYMYMSSLAETRLGQPARAQAGSTGNPASGVSAPELALAGKGFDSREPLESGGADFGSVFGADFGLKLEYAQVDRMESLAFNPGRCALFLEGGG